MPLTTTSLAKESELLDLLLPLQYFYLQKESPLPDVQILDGESVPEPARHLLVHQSDMTPRLRAFHQADIHLEVVQADKTPDFVMRMVVLRRANDHRAVEFGAIGIQLEGFDPETRGLILAGETPLGTILESREVPHTSAPKAYFRVLADDFTAGLLGEPPGTVLYGRCNSLCHPDGIIFADIVEILPSR